MAFMVLSFPKSRPWPVFAAYKMDCPAHVVYLTTRVVGKHVGNVLEKRLFHGSNGGGPVKNKLR